MNTHLTIVRTSDFIQKQGRYWMPAKTLGEKLGYQDPARSISKLYNRNADELEPFKGVVEMATPGGEQEVLAFDRHGCHILAMLAKTEQARDFRLALSLLIEKLPDIQRKLHEQTPEAVERKVKLDMAREELARHVYYSEIWTEAKLLRFMEIRNHLSNSELARVFDCGVRSIGRIKKLIRRASGDFSDHTPEAIRDKPPQLTLLDELPRLAATDEIKEAIWRMRMVEGKTYQEIADETGYSMKAVQQFVAKINAAREAGHE
ncbi:MAG: BRO family protein [Balneolales bacterium]